MSDTITFDNPSYPLWKAGYDAGIAAERAVSDRLLEALKDVHWNSLDLPPRVVERMEKLIAEVESMRKEQE